MNKKIFYLIFFILATFLFTNKNVFAFTQTYSQTINTDHFDSYNPCGNYPNHHDCGYYEFIKSGETHVLVNAISIELKNNNSSDIYTRFRFNSGDFGYCTLIPKERTIVTFLNPNDNVYLDYYGLYEFYDSNDCSHAVETENISIYGKYNTTEKYGFQWPYQGIFFTANETFYSDYPGNDINIVTPSDGSYIDRGNVTFSGTCPFNGTDRLAINYDGSNWFPDSTHSGITLSDFNIDCINFAWTTTLDLSDFYDNLNIWIIDKSWLDDPVFPTEHLNYVFDQTSIVLINPDNPYRLQLIYPNCGQNNICDNLKPSDNWIFRFKYIIPPEIDKSNIDTVLSYGCDSSFNNCSSTDVVALNLLVIDNNDYFDTNNIIIVDETLRYYKMSIFYNDVEKFNINFSTLQDTSDKGQPAVAPGTKDLGFWGNIVCSLFCPSQDFSRQMSVDLPLQLRSKVPFAYFFVAKDALSGIHDNGGTFAFNFPIQTSVLNINVPIIDLNNPLVQNAGTATRSYVVWGLWLMFIGYIWFRFTEFKP